MRKGAVLVESTTLQAINVQIEGKVQGVYFRASTAKKANALGLTGWVRNLDDGRVSLFAQGPAESIGQLLKWCQKGPVLARVVNVYQQMADIDRQICGFTVIR